MERVHGRRDEMRKDGKICDGRKKTRTAEEARRKKQ